MQALVKALQARVIAFLARVQALRALAKALQALVEALHAPPKALQAPVKRSQALAAACEASHGATTCHNLLRQVHISKFQYTESRIIVSLLRIQDGYVIPQTLMILA